MCAFGHALDVLGRSKSRALVPLERIVTGNSVRVGKAGVQVEKGGAKARVGGNVNRYRWRFGPG